MKEIKIELVESDLKISGDVERIWPAIPKGFLLFSDGHIIAFQDNLMYVYTDGTSKCKIKGNRLFSSCIELEGEIKWIFLVDKPIKHVNIWKD